jgi:hypothetical protein
LWPFLIIVFPALLAIRKVFNLGLTGLFLVSMNAVILDILIVLALTLSMFFVGKVLLTVSRRMPRFKFSFKKYISVFIVLSLLCMFAVWQKSFNHDLVKLFSAADVNAVEANVELIGENFKFLPTHIVAASIYSWQSGSLTYVLINFLSLLPMLVLLLILWWQSSVWFLDIWQALQEGRVVDGKKVGKIGGTAFSLTSTKPAVVLFRKEAMVFWRSTRGLLWMSFIFFIWFVQTMLNSMLSRNIADYSLELNNVPDVVTVMQSVTGIYFICAFVLRFVFPAFSAEKKSAWILATAPIDYSEIYWAKLAYFSGLFTLLGMIIMTVNSSFFGLSIPAYALSSAVFITTTITVIIYGLSIGAVFPNFETDDPAILSTSMPGLAFIIGSLIYGTFGGLVLYGTYSSAIIWPMVIFEISSIALCLFFVKLALQKIKNTEFEKVRN